MAKTIIADRTKVMGAIHQQAGVVFVANRLECMNVRRIGMHRKQAFGHHQNGVFHVVLADFL